MRFENEHEVLIKRNMVWSGHGLFQSTIPKQICRNWRKPWRNLRI